MRFLIGGVVAALTLLCAVAPASAAPVECPLSQARRTITNDLPSGWWTTPYIGTLTGTRVSPIGGHSALICEYGEAGTVQVNAPEANACVARSGGFDCTPIILRPIPPLPIPRTFSTGPISVPQTFVFDLDRGIVGNNALADLFFHAITADQLFLEPMNGATIAVGDGSNRNYAGCRAASYSSAAVPLGDVPVGSYVCVRTNQGRYSQFRMNAITPGSPKTLSLGYTTWR